MCKASNGIISPNIISTIEGPIESIDVGAGGSFKVVPGSSP